MWQALPNTLRLVRVARTLARHDALFPLELAREMPPFLRLLRVVAAARPPWSRKVAFETDLTPGARLTRALESLGPSFIKLGQGLATRPDLVGADIAEDLAKLHDRLDPFPGAEARATVERELGAPIDSLFEEFDDEPVAAASIAQVHFAVSSDGRKVAVKVLRPGIEAAFERDLEVFQWLAGLIERAWPPARRLRPGDVVKALGRTVAAEMDLRLEAAAASELRENMTGDSGYLIPDVDWQRTSRRVFTSERVEGIPVSDRAAIAEAGHDLKALAEKMVRVFLVQAIRDGFFHADLHHGNLFVDPDGNIVAVDFGIMGRLDWATRRYLAEILYGFLNGDYRRVAQIHFDAGYVPRSHSVDAFAQALRSIGEPILGRPVREISFAHLLARLFRTTETFDMRTQPQLLLLQKTMVMIEGVAQHLDPDVNMWEISKPVVETWMRENLGPEARLRETAGHLFSVLRRLPDFIERLERRTDSVLGEDINLHPQGARAMAREQRKGRRSLTAALWTIAALLAILVLFVA